MQTATSVPRAILAAPKSRPHLVFNLKSVAHGEARIQQHGIASTAAQRCSRLDGVIDGISDPRDGTSRFGHFKNMARRVLKSGEPPNGQRARAVLARRANMRDEGIVLNDGRLEVCGRFDVRRFSVFAADYGQLKALREQRYGLHARPQDDEKS